MAQPSITNAIPPGVTAEQVSNDAKSEARVQKAMVQTPEGQQDQRQRAGRRIFSGLLLTTTLVIVILWVPDPLRRIMLRSFINNGVLVGLTLLFALMSMSLLWATGQKLDVWLFRTLRLRGQESRSVWMDRLMWAATQIGNFPFAGVVIALAYFTGHRGFAIGLAIGSLTLLLLVTVLKAMTDRSRPFNLMRDVRVIGVKEWGLSFPSGHTTQTFFMMSSIAAYYEPAWFIVVGLYAVAVLVGFTRVYLGVHYPRDVIAGAILGLFWSVLIGLIAPFF